MTESDEATPLELEINDDTSFAICSDDLYWSARKERGTFDLRPFKDDWEHFTLERAEFALTSEYIPPLVTNFTPTEREEEPTVKLRATVPAISVVIPMFNVEDCVEECLTSLLEQTFQDFEVIVIDDGSTDRSAEIVEGMAPRFDGRLTLLRFDRNGGEPGTPRNVGINCAVGKYIYFLDADDMIVRHALEYFHRVAEENHGDVVHTGKCYAFKGNKHYVDIDTNKLIKHVNRECNALEFMPYDLSLRLTDFYRDAYGFGVAPWHHFVRREFIVENRIKFLPTTSVDDTMFAFCCTCCAKIYIHVPEVLYIYRGREGSLTRPNDSALDSRIAKHITVAGIVSENLDRFMDELSFFDKHLNFRWLVCNRFFDYCMNGNLHMLSHYDENSAGVIHCTARKKFIDGVSFSESSIAYLIAATIINSELSSEKTHTLEELSRYKNAGA